MIMLWTKSSEMLLAELVRTLTVVMMDRSGGNATFQDEGLGGVVDVNLKFFYNFSI